MCKIPIDWRTWPKIAQGVDATSNRRSFDYASRDETARGSAQDDKFL
jgi:hypothetical protein